MGIRGVGHRHEACEHELVGRECLREVEHVVGAVAFRERGVEARDPEAEIVEERAVLRGLRERNAHVLGEDLERDRAEDHRLDADITHLRQACVGAIEVVDQLPSHAEEIDRERAGGEVRFVRHVLSPDQLRSRALWQSMQ